MDEYGTLNHTTWDCKYHLVFIPKYRRKVLYQELRKPLGEVFPHPRLGPRYSDSAHPDPVEAIAAHCQSADRAAAA